MEVSGQFHVPVALPAKKVPGTHCVEGWIGPKAGLDAVARRDICSAENRIHIAA
jgi:hypothetical protein